ncbi:hypothetical protein C3729_04165 [Cloacibacterium normanense]|uniref:Uncharacterized protein n=1 Tax=Cloacibacterium normanense TaxID=237258 RepID=A0A2S7I6M5_9FLAO|nr:hypothetical protein C3729_04165 [Cloacibacterium normanense]
MDTVKELVSVIETESLEQDTSNKINAYNSKFFINFIFNVYYYKYKMSFLIMQIFKKNKKLFCFI